MKNYICINGRKINLTIGQVRQIEQSLEIDGTKLADVAVGDTVKISDFEMVVLEHTDAGTSLILKDMYGEDTAFSNSNNDYRGSIVDGKCQEFAAELAEIVSWDNIVLHKVDLTSDDGLKDYGEIKRRASSLTAEQYRKYVDILDKCKLDKWWWLATPHSTKRHENDAWVKCVSPSGGIDNYLCGGVKGVRPFCILKSNIFVSRKGA